MKNSKNIRDMMNFVVMLKEGNTFIAWNPIFDESSEGSTISEARRGLEDAIHLRLKDKNMPLPKVTVEGFSMVTTTSIPISVGDIDAENSQTVKS